MKEGYTQLIHSETVFSDYFINGQRRQNLTGKGDQMCLTDDDGRSRMVSRSRAVKHSFELAGIKVQPSIIDYQNWFISRGLMESFAV
jgi:hypothetical protein